MKNIVLKAALITVGALAAAGILVFSLWILISPQSMATVSERLGNYGFAVTCAHLKYKYSDDTADLARCAEDGILSGDDGLVVKYCGQLVEKSDFGEVCRQKDEELSLTLLADYRTYIIGNLAAAQYREGGLDKALETAGRGEARCFAKLVLEIAENGSAADKEKAKAALSKFDADSYVNGLIALLSE